MSVKNVSLFALALTLLGVGAVHAQDPAAVPYGPAAAEEGPPPQPGQLLNPAAPPHVLSSWILYNKPCCCGPLGEHRPLHYELYLRAGPSFPIEGSVFGRTLETGWDIEGGARLLFFNLPQTAAWTLDLGLGNVHNNSRRADVKVPIIRRDPNPNFNRLLPVSPTNQPFIRVDDPVTIRALNRTFVNFSGGREWYVIGNGSCEGPAWRIGADFGGSWGTAKAEFFEIRHRTDVVGRLFVAIHSDVDVPCGCCIFTFGVRGVWDYSFSDVLQKQNNGDLQDIQVLGTIGVRF